MSEVVYGIWSDNSIWNDNGGVKYHLGWTVDGNGNILCDTNRNVIDAQLMAMIKRWPEIAHLRVCIIGPGGRPIDVTREAKDNET